jgi:hypothetical protein
MLPATTRSWPSATGWHSRFSVRPRASAFRSMLVAAVTICLCAWTCRVWIATPSGCTLENQL